MPTRIEVPIGKLSSDALEGLIDEFITREGTDYGEREYALTEKRASVLKQLQRAEVAVVYDFESESTTLVTREELRRLDAGD
jgi:uncharacterized protein YheU (UPF0270 family)